MIFIYPIILFVIVRPTYQVLYACNSIASSGCSLNSTSVTRIVGREAANTATCGWAVSLSFSDGSNFLCGASILSNSWIITAAQCVIYYAASEIVIHSGPNIQCSGTQNRTVSEIILRANFDGSTFPNDIALLKLTFPLNMSDLNLNPICMPHISSTTLKSGEWPVVNTTVVAVEWGKLSENGLLPRNLHQVTLYTIDYQVSSCSKLIYDKHIQLSVGVSGGDKDTCQSDSGGPLMMFTPNNSWVLIDLISFGEEYARKNSSEVYTRIAAYENWIRSYTNDFYWIALDSYANMIFISITHLFFFITPFFFILIIY